MLIFNEEDHEKIKNLAHNIFLEESTSTYRNTNLTTEKFYVTMCYSKAVLQYIEYKGFQIIPKETIKED